MRTHHLPTLQHRQISPITRLSLERLLKAQARIFPSQVAQDTATLQTHLNYPADYSHIAQTLPSQPSIILCYRTARATIPLRIGYNKEPIIKAIEETNRTLNPTLSATVLTLHPEYALYDRLAQIVPCAYTILKLN